MLIKNLNIDAGRQQWSLGHRRAVKAVREAGEWCVIISVLDNLVKGASGQAIQNMNIANGWCETTALL